MKKTGARLPVADELEAKQALGIKIIPTFKEAGLTNAFANRVRRYVEVQEQIKSLEEEKARLVPEIGSMVQGTGYKTLLADEYKVTSCDGTNRSVSKEKLLELGVPATTILAATVTKEYSYISVARNKEA